MALSQDPHQRKYCLQHLLIAHAVGLAQYTLSGGLHELTSWTKSERGAPAFVPLVSYQAPYAC